MEWRCKRVLVTGASGFLGTPLTARLLDMGATVFADSRQERKSTHDNLTWLRYDLSEPEAAKEMLAQAKPDIVYHLAGFADGGRDRQLVVPNFERNGLITVRLLSAVALQDCERFIYAASMEEPDPFDCILQPNGPYSAAKWVGTVYTLMFHRLYGLPTVALRIFLTYGPGPQVRTKLIPYTIVSLLAGRSPEVSSGARLVDLVYIDDVVEALLLAASSEKAVGEIVEVGGGERHSIRQILETAAREVGCDIGPSFGAVADRPDEMMPTADIERSYRLLGWRPAMPLDEGMKRTVAWYRRQVEGVI